MTNAVPVRETREVLLARAREAMKLAEAETLPHRARIHILAAERWIVLAERKLQRDEDERPVHGQSVLPSTQPRTCF
jgi:hypothetical protein